MRKVASIESRLETATLLEVMKLAADSSRPTLPCPASEVDLDADTIPAPRRTKPYDFVPEVVSAISAPACQACNGTGQIERSSGVRIAGEEHTWISACSCRSSVFPVAR